jgi:hypothetical protein
MGFFSVRLCFDATATSLREPCAAAANENFTGRILGALDKRSKAKPAFDPNVADKS